MCETGNTRRPNFWMNPIITCTLITIVHNITVIHGVFSQDPKQLCHHESWILLFDAKKKEKKTPKFISQHSRFRSLKEKTRGLRAIRVSLSCRSRQWIFPHFFHHFFFLSQSEGACPLHCFMALRLRALIGRPVWLLDFMSVNQISLKQYNSCVQVWLGVDGPQGRVGWRAKNVTRQGRERGTWAQTSLAKKYSGAGRSGLAI